MTAPRPLMVVRTAPAFYWLVGGILGAALALGIVVVALKTSAGWPPTIILAVLLTAALAVFLSTRLVLTEERIHYRSLFVIRDVRLTEIMQARLNVGFTTFKPYQRLVLTVSDQRGKREITINTGLFDRVKIKRLVDMLNACLR